MTTSTPEHRYPLEPLAAAMHLTIPAACRALRISGSTEQQYRRDGVTDKVADRLAIRAGFHPYEIWPDMADHQLADVSKPCADEKCDELYVPSTASQRFCSPTCRKRDAGRRYVRRRYRTDPEFAERRRRESRQWRAEGGEAWRRSERRRQKARYDPAERRARYERAKARLEAQPATTPAPTTRTAEPQVTLDGTVGPPTVGTGNPQHQPQTMATTLDQEAAA